MKTIKKICLFVFVIAVFFVCSCGEKVIEEGKYSWVGEAFNEDGSVFAYVEKGKGIKNVGVLSSTGEFKSFGEFGFSNAFSEKEEIQGGLFYLKISSGDGENSSNQYLLSNGEVYDALTSYCYPYNEDFEDEDKEYNGYFILERASKYTIVDKEGKDLIGEEVDEVEYFERSLIYRVGEKWGYITDALLVVKAEYDAVAVGEYDDKIEVEKDGKWTVVRGNINEAKFSFEDYRKVIMFDKGKEIFKVQRRDGKWGLLNKKGKEILPFEFVGINKGLFDSFIVSRKPYKWGVVDEKGKTIVEPIYLYIDYDYYEENSLKIYKEDDEAEEVLVGAVYGNRKVYISDTYDSVDYIKDDDFIVRKNDLWYVINVKTGERNHIVGNYNDIFFKEDSEGVLGGSYLELYSSGEEKIGGRELPQKGIADMTGKVLLESIYDDICFVTKNVILVKKDQEWTAINYSKDGEGRYVIETESYGHKKIFCLDVFSFSNAKTNALNSGFPYEKDSYIGGKKDKDLLFSFRENDKVGLINIEGDIIVEAKYYSFEPFVFWDEGERERLVDPYLIFSEKIEGAERFGIMNKEGKVILNAEYSYIEEYVWNDKNVVRLKTKDNKKKIYNIKGNIFSEEYDMIAYFDKDTARVRTNGKRGLVDVNDGTVILDTEYDEIKQTKKYLSVKKDDKYGLYDINKREFFLPIEYESIKFFDNGNAIVKKDGLFEFIRL